ncbi:hypothetical protein X275_09450 [Marinitoga sp. 1197]|uniref:hypothetical protein n=1 Tax=Marinitoga sp. 1197 TaxID=1428449 RepID=UPI00064185DC|nr:hypothetical protein [Marinitoga sp. 1197]KLO21348.1 hypothetical protein X275_09450 [Marinitoga sp. 1197]
MEQYVFHCPNCHTAVPYLLVCKKCGWVGCENELKRGFLGQNCPNCGSKISKSNRERNPKKLNKAFEKYNASKWTW